ncbi:MAG: hypothetical protein HF976_09560 [ANME-2 cluster archaeon]|nr:hypothetical protein [ANME-2 cluster archaeon]MBC2701641.1 hypothetical protein [ANME-2 cluster archaeon]MBC2746481.1 hypothetical protein [ANME-2 cluster archaeon]
MLYCCTGCDGTLWRCPDQPGKYGEGWVGAGALRRYGRGVLGDIGERVVREDERCVVCYKKSKCGRGC